MIHQRRMREMLQSFADRELSAAEYAWVAHHLECCGECSASLRRLQESDRLLGAARPQPAALPREAARALFARALEEAGAPRAALWPGSQPFSWAFGAALAVAAGAAFAWWTMAGGGSGGGLTREASLRPSAGVLVADTWTNAAGGAAPHKKDGGTRAGSGTRTVPEEGAMPKQKKETPTLEAPGAKAPGDRQQPRRMAPSRYRYLVNTAGSAVPGVKTHPSRTGAGGPAGVEFVSGPLPRSFLDPEGEIAARSTVASGLEPGQMLVMVTPERAPSPVAVTCASPEAPGFARASAIRSDGSGGWLWTEATVRNECAGPERSLVMLGSTAWPWEEERDDQVWGEPDDEMGDSAAAPAGAVGEPAVQPGGGAVSGQTADLPGSAVEPACSDDPGSADDPGADGC